MTSSSSPRLRQVWTGGLAYAGLLVLVGLASWALALESVTVSVLGYGSAAVLVLAFSRGLYHRNLASGVLLFGIVLGTVTRGAILWRMGSGTMGLVDALLDGIVVLGGLALLVPVIRGLKRLWMENRV